MNVITKQTLLDYCEKHPNASQNLFTWYQVAVKATWKNFNEVKNDFPSADQVGNDRMVFNIKGNRYRLVVRFSFPFKVIQIKWFGTHAEYDRIDVKNVQIK